MTRPLALSLALLLVPTLARSQSSTNPVPNDRPRTPMHKGDVAQTDGVLLSIPETARIVRVCTEAQTERDRLRLIVSAQPAPEVIDLPTSVTVSLGIGLAVGVLAGAVLTYRATR